MRPRAFFLALFLTSLAVPAAAQEHTVLRVGPKGRLSIDSGGYVSVVGARQPCTAGKAAGFACSNVDLLSFLAIEDLGGGSGTQMNDVWGWTDPASGKEYALAGRTDGLAIVDVSDPVRPLYVGNLPSENGRVSVWRDMKVLGHYAVVVADFAGPHGMQIFDLHRVRDVTDGPVDFEPDVVYREFQRAHNVAVNEETGFAYAVGTETCGGGLHMIDLRDPLDPRFAGCFAEASTGLRGTGYTHDVQCVTYHGPDADYVGREICFASNETAVAVIDVTDKSAPRTLGIAEYPYAQYVHQGWLTPDHAYFLVDDELDEVSVPSINRTRTIILDVSVLEDPIFLTEYFGTTPSIDHNQFIVGNRVFQANYASGLRILDIEDVEYPREVGYFDTYPPHDSAIVNGLIQFVGAWSNYPFFESGIVLVSSIGEGLFVVEPTGPANVSAGFEEPPHDFRLLATYPNPFNSHTRIRLEVERGQDVQLVAFDVRGREVARLFSGRLPAGGHEFVFDASGLAGGVYVLRATGEATSRSVTVVYQK